MKILAKVLLFCITLTSCGTLKYHKTSDFASIYGITDLEGCYLNQTKDYSLLSCFNIRDIANFVSISVLSPNEIKLTYHNDSTIHEQVFKGEMKGKYFEIYFSKQQVIIPILYSSCTIDRLRIGKSKTDEILVRKFVDQSGNVLFLAAGYSYETPYLFLNKKDYKGYIPFQINGKWGYKDVLGETEIPVKYDFAGMFENDVARVKLNNKWGLINIKGQEITPLKYDYISLLDTKFSPPIFRVNIGSKVGILDVEGKETIPVIYDFIANSNMSHYGYFSIRLGEKKGYANRTQVVIPAIYSRLFNFDGNTAVAMRDGEYYIVDIYGYEFETTGKGFMRTPKLETRRKIQFNEQVIE